MNKLDDEVNIFAFILQKSVLFYFSGAQNFNKLFVFPGVV
jgi:hypothetical protein